VREREYHVTFSGSFAICENPDTQQCGEHKEFASETKGYTWERNVRGSIKKVKSDLF